MTTPPTDPEIRAIAATPAPPRVVRPTPLFAPIVRQELDRMWEDYRQRMLEYARTPRQVQDDPRPALGDLEAAIERRCARMSKPVTPVA